MHFHDREEELIATPPVQSNNSASANNQIYEKCNSITQYYSNNSMKNNNTKTRPMQFYTKEISNSKITNKINLNNSIFTDIHTIITKTPKLSDEILKKKILAASLQLQQLADNIPNKILISKNMPLKANIAEKLIKKKIKHISNKLNNAKIAKPRIF